MEKIVRLNETQLSELITKIIEDYENHDNNTLNEAIDQFEDKHIIILFDIVKRLEDSVKRIEKRMDDTERYYRG